MVEPHVVTVAIKRENGVEKEKLICAHNLESE